MQLVVFLTAHKPISTLLSNRADGSFSFSFVRSLLDEMRDRTVSELEVLMAATNVL